MAKKCNYEDYYDSTRVVYCRVNSVFMLDDIRYFEIELLSGIKLSIPVKLLMSYYKLDKKYLDLSISDDEMVCLTVMLRHRFKDQLLEFSRYLEYKLESSKLCFTNMIVDKNYRLIRRRNSKEYESIQNDWKRLTELNSRLKLIGQGYFEYINKRAIYVLPINQKSVIVPKSTDYIQYSKAIAALYKAEDLSINGCKLLPPNGFTNNHHLRYVRITSKIDTIPYNIFYGCSSLEGITLPRTIKYIKDGAFRDCTRLEEINLSEGLLEIGESAFWNCSHIKDIRIPNGVTTLGNYVFNGCRLKSLYIPKSVKNIDINFFTGSTIRNLYISRNLSNILKLKECNSRFGVMNIVYID